MIPSRHIQVADWPAACWIGGAAFDVFDPEILSKESPFYTLNKVILWRHTAWCSRPFQA